MGSESSPGEHIIVSDDLCDFSQARLTKSMTGTGFEESTQEFWSTIDRVKFRSVGDIVQTVLLAQGYVVDLENILACLDNLRLGVRAKVTVREEEKIIRAYNYALQFSLPSKERVGPILSRFYTSIKSYEAEIARLRGEVQQDDDKGEKSQAEVRRELSLMHRENEQLKKQLADISQKLLKSERSHATASKALAAQNVLPGSLRIATLRSISTKDRSLTLRLGRKTIRVSTWLLNTIPKLGSQCLVSADDRDVESLFFFDSSAAAFRPFASQVLLLRDSVLRVRDENRRIHTLYLNAEEMKRLGSCRRHDPVLLYAIDGEIVRIDAMSKDAGETVTQQIQESIVKHQLLDDEVEKLIYDPSASRKKDVA